MTLGVHLPKKEYEIHKFPREFELIMKILEALYSKTMGVRELERQAKIHDKQWRRVLPLLKKKKFILVNYDQIIPNWRMCEG